MSTLTGPRKREDAPQGWYGYVYPKSVSLFARTENAYPFDSFRAQRTRWIERGELYFVGSGGGGGGGYGIILEKTDISLTNMFSDC